jgi:hypothetical protein
VTPHETMLALTGAVVTWWGRIEGSLFQDLLIAQRHSSVKAEICAPLPVGTKNLITTWIKTMGLVENEQAWFDEIKRIAAGLRDCAEDRHVIVHAFWDYPDPAQADRSKLTIIKPAKGSPGQIRFAQYHMDIPKLAEMEQRFRTLYHRVMASSLNLSVRVNRAEAQP